MCGKTYPVRVGDVIKTEDLLPYICRKCAGNKGILEKDLDALIAVSKQGME